MTVVIQRLRIHYKYSSLLEFDFHYEFNHFLFPINAFCGKKSEFLWIRGISVRFNIRFFRLTIFFFFLKISIILAKKVKMKTFYIKQKQEPKIFSILQRYTVYENTFLLWYLSNISSWLIKYFKQKICVCVFYIPFL